MIADLKIALIQSDLHWENSEANRAMFEEKIWQIEGAIDLIVLPEMFSTGFTMNAAKVAEPEHTHTFQWMKQQAAQSKAVIIGSYVVKGSGNYYNRLYAVYPDGSSQHYDKRHLFGLAGESDVYSAGNQRLIINVKGWKILPLICYDLRFPVWARSQRSDKTLYEYDLLVYVSNWPEARIEAWDRLLPARSIENAAYCVGVNRVGKDGAGARYPGHSALFDYKGNLKVFSSEDEILFSVLSYSDLSEFRERYPFQSDADSFTFKF